jgi:hypothetical protein
VANKWDERKKAKEDEYFVKQERELLAKMKAKQEVEAKEAAKNGFVHGMSEVRRAAKRAEFSESTDRSMRRLQWYLARCRGA